MSIAFKRVLWSASFLAAFIPVVLLALPRSMLTFEEVKRFWILAAIVGILSALAASEVWRQRQLSGPSFWALALNMAFLLVLGYLYAISIAHLD
jgi:hypothetical protein